jgi:glycosidase
VDAALDFPLFYKLPGCAKGLAGQSARALAGVFEERKVQHKNLLSSHGEAGRFFVTFLDNHDQHSRFFYSDPNGTYDAQLPLGVCLLFTLQGIPCVYYGTEQGLHGRGHSDKYVREALWGKPDAFDTTNKFFQAIKSIAKLRADIPALRYGRQYFREVSGDGFEFGISPFSPAILAFCRILNDEEVLIVANAQTKNSWQGHVIVDFALNPPAGTDWKVLFSNNEHPEGFSSVTEQPAGTIRIANKPTGGRTRSLTVSLRPMEVQVLGKF